MAFVDLNSLPLPTASGSLAQGLDLRMGAPPEQSVSDRALALAQSTFFAGSPKPKAVSGLRAKYQVLTIVPTREVSPPPASLVPAPAPRRVITARPVPNCPPSSSSPSECPAIPMIFPPFRESEATEKLKDRYYHLFLNPSICSARGALRYKVFQVRPDCLKVIDPVKDRSLGVDDLTAGSVVITARGELASADPSHYGDRIGLAHCAAKSPIFACVRLLKAMRDAGCSGFIKVCVIGSDRPSPDAPYSAHAAGSSGNYEALLAKAAAFNIIAVRLFETDIFAMAITHRRVYMNYDTFFYNSPRRLRGEPI